MPIHRSKGFTAVELIVVLVATMAILGILVAVLGKARKGANILGDSVNQRYIIAAAMAYAATNKDWCPGLDSTGQYATTDFSGKHYFAKNTIINAHTGAGATTDALNNYAMALLLDEAAITPNWMIAPDEISGNLTSPTLNATQATPDDIGKVGVNHGEVTRVNFGHALLQYGVATLKGEWRANQNQQAILMGTRVIFSEDPAVVVPGKFSTIFTDAGSGHYKGSIVRGDGSATTEHFKAFDIPSVFGTLKYNQLTTPPSAIEFTPTAHDASAVGVFGKSGPTLGNFGASATQGQIGSAND